MADITVDGTDAHVSEGVAYVAIDAQHPLHGKSGPSFATYSGDRMPWEGATSYTGWYIGCAVADLERLRSEIAADGPVVILPGRLPA